MAWPPSIRRHGHAAEDGVEFVFVLARVVAHGHGQAVFRVVPVQWIIRALPYSLCSINALISAIICASLCAMSTTITVGKSGRLVVPKSIRERLGIHEGSRLKLEVLGGSLQAVPESDPVNITIKGGFPIIHGGPAWKRGDVVRAIKADRDSRDERATPRSRQK